MSLLNFSELENNLKKGMPLFYQKGQKAFELPTNLPNAGNIVSKALGLHIYNFITIAAGFILIILGIIFIFISSKSYKNIVDITGNIKDK